jgi:cytochrome c oxidase assembly protein subunit 15
MSNGSRLSSFQRLCLSTTAATYFLILVGGFVRASGAGLGCPDWPRCFGSWIPPSSADQLPARFDRALFNPALMWTEYLNRLLGVIVGFLILATVISAWRHQRHNRRVFWSVIGALLLTGFQGWLGGRVVANALAAWIVTIHMILALIIVQLLLYATVRSDGNAPVRFSLPVAGLILVTMVQIGVGTQVRGAIDTAIGAGISRGAALAAVGWVDDLHRNTALVVFAGAIGNLLWLRSNHAAGKWSYIVACLAALQIALGVTMAYGSLSSAAQVAHLTVASLLLGAETVLLLTPEVPATGTPI